VAAEYLAGGLVGGLVGMALATSLAPRKAALNRVFASLIFIVAGYMPSDAIVAVTAKPGSGDLRPFGRNGFLHGGSRQHASAVLHGPRQLRRVDAVAFEPGADREQVRMCVQRRLACSAGDKPAGVEVRAP